MTTLRLAIIPLVSLISACAATGPANDGFEHSHESLDIGKIQENEWVGQVVKKATESIRPEEKNAAQKRQ